MIETLDILARCRCHLLNVENSILLKYMSTVQSIVTRHELFVYTPDDGFDIFIKELDHSFGRFLKIKNFK